MVKATTTMTKIIPGMDVWDVDFPLLPKDTVPLVAFLEEDISHDRWMKWLASAKPEEYKIEIAKEMSEK